MTEKTKFSLTPKQVALQAMSSAIDAAQKELIASIKSCGELSGKDSKQSDQNKQYFADMSLTYQQACTELSNEKQRCTQLYFAALTTSTTSE